MKLKLSIFAVSALFSVSAFASPIGPEQALSRAFSTGPKKAVSIERSNLKLVHTALTPKGIASSYIFKNLSDKGFLIVSADDVAAPLLAYSDHGIIDENNLPPALKVWLEQYGRQIEWMLDNDAQTQYTKPYAPANWAPVDPMLVSTWNQDAPYNDQCPLISGTHAATGCVATAAAQIMYYYKYPEAGDGLVRYTDANGAIRSLNLSNGFKWDQMLDNYKSGQYTSSQGSAVAYLMACCGFAAEMNYSVEASGTQSYKMANAFKDRFFYSQDIIYRDRNIFSADQWAEKIYNNLKNIGPVYYDGSSYTGGHAFVCDGYDGNGYFHFNWGWGGLSDGYYLLDTLNPESQGIGGAEGGFNYQQSAIFNIRKPDGTLYPDYDNIKLYGNIRPTLEGNVLNLAPYNNYGQTGWGNASWRSIVVQLGAIIEDSKGNVVSELLGDVSPLESNRLSIPVYQLLNGEKVGDAITLPKLADGTYRVIAAARQYGTMPDGSNYPWQPVVCEWGNINYCTISVEGGNVTAQEVAPFRLSFEGEGLSSPLYLKRNARLGLQLVNNTDIQLTSCFYPALYKNGRVQYRGDYMLATVNAGESLYYQGVVDFAEVPSATFVELGTYNLVMLDAASGALIKDYGEVEMKNITTNFSVQLEDFFVPDAKVTTLTRGSKTFEDAYEIFDASDFEIDLSYVVKTGYFDSPLRIFMSEYNPDTDKFTVLKQDAYYDIPFTGVGETSYLKLPMNMSGYNTAAVYRVVASYQFRGADNVLGMMYIGFDPASVDGILDDDAQQTPVYYNLQGQRIDHPQKGQILIKRMGSKSQKVIF